MSFPAAGEVLLAEAQAEQVYDATAELSEDGDGSKPMSGRRKKAAQTKQKKSKPGSFDSMGLSIPVLKAIKRKGFQLPTPIQRKTIPLILQGMDVVGMARTGSGKTGAFVIPLVHKLEAHKPGAGARALFLAPTRELALQTYKVITEIGKHTDLRTAVLVGGDSMQAQFAELATSPDMIVATPGRLLHHLAEIPTFTLRSVMHIVLDEADRLFEMGLGDQVKDVLKQTSESRQVLLFSATLPSAVAEFAAVGLRAPELVRLDADTKISPDLKLVFFGVKATDKAAALVQAVHELLPRQSPTIVFAATKHMVEYLCMLLEAEGIQCTAVYGSMDQTARKISVGKFRAGKVSIMLVTDVAARGIDIPLIDNVINYDFTPKPKLFVHRVGRAARAGRSGTAYSFVTTDELPYLIDLHLFLSRPLRVVPQLGANAEDQGQAGDADEKVSWLGSYPENVLDMVIERVRDTAEHDASMNSLARSCENALALYKKTRPAASTESLKRARALPQPGPHPLLTSMAHKRKFVDMSAELGKSEFTAALKKFRPAATVLEAQVAAGRRAEGAGHAAVAGVRGASELDRKNDVMRQKRVAHGQSIAAHYEEQSNRAAAARAAGRSGADTGAGEPAADAATADACIGYEVGSGRFRDADFFISAERADRHAEAGFSLAERGHHAIAAEVLDIGAEDSEGLAAQQRRRRTVWDNKKKRYVQLQSDETMKAGKRVKSDRGKHGGGGDESSGALYKQWVKHVGGKVGDTLGKGAKGGASALAGRFLRGGRGWENPLGGKRANAGVKSDVKTEGEMRKAAKKKERTQQHLQKKRGGVKKKQGGKGGKGRRFSC